MMNLMQKSNILDWYQKMGIHEFMPSFGWFKTDLGVLFCSAYDKVCADVVGEVMDGDPTLDNYDRYDVIVGHVPAGTSVLNMQHWRQSFLNKSFRAYDYGSIEENKKHYDSAYPPEWRLDNIRIPLHLFWG